MSRVIVDDKKYYTKTIKRYINALFSVLATLPDDCNYGCVNIKNRALLLSLGLSFTSKEGYKKFLEDHELITLSKDDSYKSPLTTVVLQYFRINLQNICNFLTSLAVCEGKRINLPCLEHFTWRSLLPEAIRKYFIYYTDKTSTCLPDFNEGKHYSIRLAKTDDIELSIIQESNDIESCEIG